MKSDLNKKKKRKITRDTVEIPVEKKKLNNQDGPAASQNQILDGANCQKENDRKREKKKKKRKGEEIEGCCSIEKKPKSNNDSVQNDGKENHSNGLGASAAHIDEDNDEEEGDNIKISEKEANALSGKGLRKSFNSRQGLDALRKFLAVCRENKERDLAADYLQAGGNVLEILRLLETCDKKNVNNASSVFAAMHLILIKILSEFPQYRSNAEEACRHLINSHLSFVHGMLSSQSNAKHRKVVLRLLASMVSLGGNLPRELLAHLSFHTQVLDTLTQQTKPTDSQSVRTCYLHFVLAFLVEGNPSVIRALLDKRGMLSCIFPELTYDSHTTVHLVLDTVKTWVLENPAISKTTKLHVFSTPVLQSIVSLYNWKGPKNWPGPKGKKGERTKAKDFVDPEEKKIAVEAVENFLTTLLTSNRHGVIFHDRSLGTSGRKYNQLVNTVLQSLERPWEHSKPLELVIKILIACPDLVRAQLIYTEPFLEPRASQKWILAMRFVARLIESVNPEYCLKPCLSELSHSQLLNAVQDLSLPLVVLKSATTPALDNENIMIRHEGVMLLKKMLKQAKIYCEVVEKESNEADYIVFRNSMMDYISKYVPSLEKMFNVWNLGLTDGPHMERTDQQPELQEFIPSKFQHFDAILDLIEAHRDICPELQTDVVSTTGLGGLGSEIFIAGLDKIQDIDENDLERMKIKAIRFLLSVDPAAFAPNKCSSSSASSASLFRETLVFLLRTIRPSENQADFQCRETVKILLTSCGIFEGCQDQIDIWIENIADLENEDEKNRIARWFVEIVQGAIDKADKYLDLVVEAEEAAVGQEILGSDARLQNIFDELTTENNGDELQRGRSNIAPIISISPVACSAIENARTNSHDILILKYLSRVIIEMLHCQVSPGTLIHLTRQLDNFPAKKYLNSWLLEEKPTCMKREVSTRYACRRKLSKILLIEEEEANDDDDQRIKISRIEQIFQGSKNKIQFLYRGKEIVLVHDFDPYDIYNLLRMTLFYLGQCIQRGQLSQGKFDSHKLFIIAFLHAAKSVDKNLVEKCSSLIFKHPSILQYFLPLGRSKDNNTATILGDGIVDIFRHAIHLNDPQSLPTLFSSFKDKFIGQLCLAIKKSKDGKKIKYSEDLIELMDILLSTTSGEVVDLLTRIMDLPKSNFLAEKTVGLSIWGNLVPKLMEILTMRNNHNSSDISSSILSVNTNVVRKIISYLCQLKIYSHIRMDLWESNLQRFLECYPQHIAAIDGHAFNSLLKRSKNSSTINLISFLASRNDQFILLFVQFVSNVPKAITESDLIFPIIANRLTYSWSEIFLKKIHNHYKNDIIRYFAEPQESDNWISRNIKVAAFLIDSCFETTDCEEACGIVLSNGDKLDNVDLGYVELLRNVFEKSSKLRNNSEEIPLTELIQVLIRITVGALKKNAKNEDKLETLCQSLMKTVDSLKTMKSDFIYEELSKNYSWPQFTRFSLKLGMKASKEENKHAPLLKTLARVCDVAYKDASENEYVKTLFEMTTSHSEFVNSMLSSRNVKKDLAELILVLIRKNHSTMTSSQIPLYLAAYNATLSESDQFILLILQHYEANKIKFNEFKPYLWGEAAASHYSVKGEADTALWRQPSASQVLDLFSSDIVEETIKRFPVHRDLWPSGPCTAAAAAAANVYDPSFYLPLLSYLLSDNNVVACHKVTQSGALALVFAAFGSTRAEIRLAAYTIISRFYFHLEATTSKEKCLWMRLIDSVRNGILDTNSSLKDFRTSCLVSTFLARAALVTTQPMNILYSPIQAFFMAKPALEFNAIPELLQLFHSSEVEHVAHRHWILQVIRDGMRTQIDMDVALKSVVFKMLLDFYSSLLADPITKRLILEIIESTVKIPKAGLLLTRSYGLLAWLSEAVSTNLTSHDVESVQIIVGIVCEIFHAVTNMNDRDKDSQFMLLNVLKNVKTCLSKNTSVNCFNNYTSSLREILQTKTLRLGLNGQDLRELVKIGKQVYADVDDIYDALENGGIEYLARTEHLQVLDDDDDISIGRANLRKLVFTWCGGNGSRL